MAGHPGKRGGAVNVEASLTAPMTNDDEKGSIDEIDNIVTPAVLESEIQIFDAYAVGYNPKHIVQPFVHRLNILSPNGNVIRVQANFDDGALINAMSATKFNEIKHKLGHYRPSSCLLRT